jgi:hypothetical protein
MKTRRIGAGLAAAGVLTVLTATPGFAEEAQVSIVPAPPGEADAVAVEIGPIKIGHASAQAGPSGSEADSGATANAVEINGESPAEQFGGSQKGKGKKRGQFLEGSREGMGSIRVTPWDAEVADRDGGGTRSDSSAALLEIIGEGLLRVDVARGEAHAEHDGKDSKGSAVSDGARVYLGPENELQIIVLHAEARSDNTGETYLVGINDQKIGTNEQLSQCPLSVPQLVDVSVNCVSAGGGEGLIQEVKAQTAGIGLVPADGQGIRAASATGRSAAGSSVAMTAAPAPEPAAAPVPAELPASAPEDAGLLPRTGSGVGMLAAVGAAMASLGMAIVALGRRFNMA